MNVSVINVAKLFEGAYNRDKLRTRNTPPPLFGQDAVYKIGGRINGTLRYDASQEARLNRVERSAKL